MNFKDTYNIEREYLDKTGIYSITHTMYAGHVYIGSASKYDKKKYRDVGFLQRWRNHFSSLRRGVHHNYFLQSVVNKYGLSGIRFDVVEFCDPFMCAERETFHIRKAKETKKTFNFSDFSNPLLGVKQSLYTIEKKVASRRKVVYQYDLSGNFLQEYISISDASRKNNILVSKISSACLRSGSAGGYQWSYKKEKKGVHKPYFNYKTPKNVFQFDLSGNFIFKHLSAKDASIKSGISINNILRSCNGFYITGGGYIWSFIKNDKRVKPTSKKRVPVLQYDKNMKKIMEFKSCSEAAVAIGSSASAIGKCCKGRYGCKTVKGFIFKYK